MLKFALIFLTSCINVKMSPGLSNEATPEGRPVQTAILSSQNNQYPISGMAIIYRSQGSDILRLENLTLPKIPLEIILESTQAPFKTTIVNNAQSLNYALPYSGLFYIHLKVIATQLQDGQNTIGVAVFPSR